MPSHACVASHMVSKAAKCLLRFSGPYAAIMVFSKSLPIACAFVIRARRNTLHAFVVLVCHSPLHKLIMRSALCAVPDAGLVWRMSNGLPSVHHYVVACVSFLYMVVWLAMPIFLRCTFSVRSEAEQISNDRDERRWRWSLHWIGGAVWLAQTLERIDSS